VQGLAAANPFDRRDPAAPANRRISILVMTREAEERVFRSAPVAEPTAEQAMVVPVPSAQGAGSSPLASHR
jgi:chemotaxis protein MotB